MIRYKLTNLTNSLGKRDSNFNKVLDISYVDNMERKKMSLRPDDTMYIVLNKLPTSVHKMRIKGLISVSEVSEREFNKILNEHKPKVTTTKKPIKKEVKPTSTKKKTTRSTKPKEDSVEK